MFITKKEWLNELGSAEYLKLSEFADTFIHSDRSLVARRYVRKWGNSFKHATRMFEYPYVYRNMGLGKPLRILDYGSGYTFFPFLLQEEGNDVTCVDIDRLVEKCFSGYEGKCKPRFVRNTEVSLPNFDNKFDVIYSVSVLEHSSAKNYEAIFKSISENLKTSGRFVLTFDISLDNNSMISLIDLKEFIRCMNIYFDGPDIANFDVKLLEESENLSTQYIRTHFPALSPWQKLRFRDTLGLNRKFKIIKDPFRSDLVVCYLNLNKK